MFPSISIIVPVFNVEKYIKKCIESLLSQSFKSFEVLIIDDDSPDKSIKIAKSIFKDDPRFVVYKKINGGLSEARNFGVKLARGQFITFLDSDDYYDPNFLEKMHSKIILDNSDIVICDMKLVDDNYSFLKNRCINKFNAISGKEAFLDNLQNITINSIAQNKLYKKELFLGISYPKGIYYEDRATTYKLFLKSKRVSFVNEPLFYYVQREGSIMNGISQKKIDDRFIVLESIKDYLKEKGIFEKYESSFRMCYLEYVVMAGSLQILKFSNNYECDISYLLNKVDNKIFNFKNLFLLLKNHKKQMLALMILKINKKLFEYLVKRVLN